jgi:hypothetical protein
MAKYTAKKRDLIWWFTVIVVIISLVSTPLLVLLSIFSSGNAIN